MFPHFKGTIVLDSPSPYSIPHIVICEAPPQPPSIIWSNAPNDPQDCGHGRYLTVTSWKGSYVNMRCELGVDEDETSCFSPAPALTEGPSRPDSPLPGMMPPFC